uniref:separase n=1 Tax=Acrobeloides nanus TaxID=290746 RepID=A0A914BUT9_9BILA
ILINLLTKINEHDWKTLARQLAEFEEVPDAPLQTLFKNYALLKAQARDTVFDEELYTLLILPPELSFLPFECLPIFGNHPLVCRITSFHLFQRLLQRAEKITDKAVEKYQLPKKVDARNSYYVLNPGADLEQTQNRLQNTIETLKWNGLVGKPPSIAEFKSALEQNDLFLYFGHGSGSKYFGRSAVRQSDCKAVSVLMGCASVRIVDEGQGFDGRSVIHEYTIARCPCIVGCLWMVTDGEIDRFFLALVNFCFAQRRSPLKEKQLSSLHRRKESADSYKLLIQGIVFARNACKLPYLTGSSVVCYGLPIASMLTQLS